MNTRNGDLTPSERRVAEQLVAGKTLKAIATEFGISYQTVRTYLKSIFQKTGARSQSQLIILMLNSPEGFI